MFLKNSLKCVTFHYTLRHKQMTLPDLTRSNWRPYFIKKRDAAGNSKSLYTPDLVSWACSWQPFEFHLYWWAVLGLVTNRATSNAFASYFRTMRTIVILIRNRQKSDAILFSKEGSPQRQAISLQRKLIRFS